MPAAVGQHQTLSGTFEQALPNDIFKSRELFAHCTRRDEQFVGSPLNGTLPGHGFKGPQQIQVQLVRHTRIFATSWNQPKARNGSVVWACQPECITSLRSGAFQFLLAVRKIPQSPRDDSGIRLAYRLDIHSFLHGTA